MPHTLPLGQSFRVIGRSPQAGQLEVTRSDGAVAVYAWAGATLRVYNGEALVDNFSFVFPELPPGMSTQSFISTMFGGVAQAKMPNMAS